MNDFIIFVWAAYITVAVVLTGLFIWVVVENKRTTQKLKSLQNEGELNTKA